MENLKINWQSKNVQDEQTKLENITEQVDSRLDKMLFEYIYGIKKSLNKRKQEEELLIKMCQSSNILFSKKLDIYTNFRYKINKDSYTSSLLKDSKSIKESWYTGDIFDIFFSDRGFTPIVQKKIIEPKLIEPEKKETQDYKVKEVPSLEEIMSKGPFESIFSTLKEKIEKLEKKTETFIISLTNNDSSMNNHKNNQKNMRSKNINPLNNLSNEDSYNIDGELLNIMNNYKKEEAKKYDSMNQLFESKLNEQSTKMQKYERRIKKQRKELQKTNYIYIGIILFILVVWVISHNIFRMNSQNAKSLKLFQLKTNLNGMVSKPNVPTNVKSEKGGHLSDCGDQSIQLDDCEMFPNDFINSPGKNSKTSAPNLNKKINIAKTEMSKS